MKKWSIAILFLLSSICLFAQDIFGTAKFGTPQDVLAAIKAGASLNERDNLGMTPLMWAAANNTNPEVITALLKAGARLDDRDKLGQTPLTVAAMNNANPEVITALLKAGARLDDRDNIVGMTPLMWAATNNANPEVVMILLKAGANGKTKSLEGKTAFDYAKDNPNIKDTAAYWALNNARF